jgi:hypothetical protein
MSFQVTHGPDRRPILVLEDEAPYSQALAAAPPAREPELDQGVWLIMAFAVWSAPDIAAIQTALDAAKHFDGRMKLGVRPFDGFEEFETWVSGTAPTNSTYWVLSRDGQKCWEHQGLHTVEELIEEIEKTGCV